MEFRDDSQTKNPFVFGAAAKKALVTMRDAHHLISNDPAKRRQWNQKAYENRWSNFSFSLLFTLVSSGFLWFPWVNVGGFFDPILRFVAVGVCGFFVFIGVVTCLWYLKLSFKKPA